MVTGVDDYEETYCTPARKRLAEVTKVGVDFGLTLRMAARS